MKDLEKGTWHGRCDWSTALEMNRNDVSCLSIRVTYVNDKMLGIYRRVTSLQVMWDRCWNDFSYFLIPAHVHEAPPSGSAMAQRVNTDLYWLLMRHMSHGLHVYAQDMWCVACAGPQCSCETRRNPKVCKQMNTVWDHTLVLLSSGTTQ